MSAASVTMGSMSDDQRHPWWRVNAIFDPDGDGGDFGYTVGLATRDVPELHLWSRPSLGDDPGLDWKLSMADTGRILNECAWRLLDGHLQVGETWTSEYDAGFVTVRFEVGEALPAAEVDAFQAGDAPVLPIRWELQRDPIGPLSPMAEGEEADAATRLDQVLQVLDPDQDGPEGWSMPDASASWAPHQPYGPRTPMVRARAAQVWQSDEDDLVELASNAMTLHGRRQAGYAVLVARAAARGAGRLDAVDLVTEAAQELTEGLGDTWARDAVPGMRDWFLEGMGEAGPEVEEVFRGLTDAMGEQILSLLVVEAVADLLPAWVVVWGQGPFLTAVSPSGIPPDERWACSEPVAVAVAGVLLATPAEALAAAAAAWDEQGGSEEALWLEALRLTGATHAPFVGSVLSEPEVAVAARALDEQGLPLVVLQQWANALAAVLSERAALEQEVVDAFLSSSAAVPGVAEVVDTPLVLGHEGGPLDDQDDE